MRCIPQAELQVVWQSQFCHFSAMVGNVAQDVGPEAQLSVMGGFTLSNRDGRRIFIPNKRVRALLAYLLLERKSVATRERLAGILWSEKDEFLARQSLRQVLVKLRAVLEEAGISQYHIDRDEIYIDSDAVSVDLESLEDRLRTGEISDTDITETVQPDRILYGLESLDGLYDSWIHHVRHAWRDRIVDRLQGLLNSADAEVSKTAANALICIDPTHEPAHRLLMRYHADRGNSPAAERQYRVLWDHLDEFGSEPEKATQDLVSRIKLGTYPNAVEEVPARTWQGLGFEEVQREVPAQPLLPFIYVHDFQTAGPGERQSSQGAGLRMEFIANLLRFRDWTILDGQQGAANPKFLLNRSDGASKSHSYAIYGTVYGADDDCSLVITLKDLDSGAYLWSDRISTHIDDWVQSQRRLTVQIASSLNTHLTAKLAASQINQFSIENDTYLQWLDCYQKFWSWDPKIRDELKKTLARIISLYPSFAPAYTGLVTILNTQHVIFPGLFADAANLREAAALSQKAVTLDPLDARNIGNFAWSCAMLGQFDQAETNFRRALELNRNNPNSAIGCANGLAMCGDVQSGCQITRESIVSLPTLTPVQWAYITSTFCLGGRYDDCIDAAQYAGKSLPTVSGFLVIAYALSGRKNEAARAADSFLQNAKLNWQGAKEPDQATICSWFVSHCPLRRDSVRDILRSGLREAGLT